MSITNLVIILELVLLGFGFFNNIRPNTLELSKTETSDIYFVHISDTHIMNKQFDK